MAARSRSYAQLQARVRGLSAMLRPLAAPGERALILMPSGEDFVLAFLACLHVGIIAVPAYPPRRNRNRERVLSIHDDAEPAVILTTATAEGNGGYSAHRARAEEAGDASRVAHTELLQGFLHFAKNVSGEQISNS